MAVATLPPPDAFCNAFWGPNQAGVNVLQSSLLSTSQQTFTDLRSVLATRAQLEEHYAKGLEALTAHALGTSEIDPVRAPLESFLSEMRKSATAHAQLAQTLRDEAESQLLTAQTSAHKVWRNKWAALVRLKQRRATEENVAQVAHAQYETDALQVQGYQRQAANADEYDRQRILDKKSAAQKSLLASRKAYAAAVQQAQDTAQRWTREWKTFCDLMQDMEEKRLDQLQSSLWNYANAVSGVCVQDDQGCEAVRQAVEAVPYEESIEAFIQQRATGREMDPPMEFYEFPAVPPSNPEPHIANFAREHPDPEAEANSVLDHTPDLSTLALSSPRPGMAPSRAASPANVSPVVVPTSSAATSTQTPPLAQQQPAATTKTPTSALSSPVKSSTSPVPAVSPFSNSSTRVLQEVQPTQSPVRPLDLNKSPTWSNHEAPPRTPTKLKTPPSKAPSVRSSAKSVFSKAGGDYEDPIEAALKRLQDKQARTPKSPARSTFSPAPSSSPSRFGSNPAVPSFPPTPGPGPTAALMQAPTNGGPRSTSPVSHQATPGLEGSVSAYEAALPGEKRTSYITPDAPTSPTRAPTSPSLSSSPMQGTGFAGVGAGGRSPSPAPFSPVPSAVPSPQPSQLSFAAPPASRPPSVRPVSPAGRPKSPLGISLNKSGKVVEDDLADQYRRDHPTAQQQQQQQPQQQPQQQQAQWSPSRTQQPTPAPSLVPQATVSGPPPPAPTGWPGYAPPSPQPGWPTTQPGLSPNGYAAPPNAYMRPTTPNGAPAPQGYMRPTTPNAAPCRPVTPQMPGGQPVQSQPPAAGYYQRPVTPLSQATMPRPGSTLPPGAMAPPAQQPGQPPTQQQGPPPQGYYAAPPPPGYAYPYQPPPQQAPPAAYGYYPPPGYPYGAYYPLAPGAPGGPAAQPPQQRPVSPAPAPAPTPAPNATAASASASAPAPAPAPTPAPASTVPAGQPTRRWPATLSSGKPVVQVVKALYDYSAQLPEEFSFATDDLILVADMPEDGWWEGEVLDPARRNPSEGEIFPSNFTTLVGSW